MGNCQRDMMLLNLWPVGALACPQIGQTSLLLSLLPVCPGESPSFFRLADYYNSIVSHFAAPPPPCCTHVYPQIGVTHHGLRWSLVPEARVHRGLRARCAWFMLTTLAVGALPPVTGQPPPGRYPLLLRTGGEYRTRCARGAYTGGCSVDCFSYFRATASSWGPFTICVCALFCLCHVLCNVPMLAGLGCVLIQPVAALFACELAQEAPHQAIAEWAKYPTTRGGGV